MQKNSGFTLIELMSSTALLSILLVGAVTVFTTTLLSQSKARIRRVLKLEGEQIVRTIEFELKNAQSISPPCDGVETNLIQYTRAGDATQPAPTREISQADVNSPIMMGPVGTLESIMSDRVKASPQLTFVCEHSPDTNGRYVTATFSLTNAQDGEIRADAGSIVESFRTGVSFRNFKAN
ncbi:MAG: prepilin-type N-terminal cleavage/methylation domain-containing protein [bacterium]|nr:prepilin-type N-terminal cleavage/methylation domain-containing protein [bacterium]